jgi:hypothetical protein
MEGRPIVLIRPIRAMVAVAVYFTVCIVAGEIWNLRRWGRQPYARSAQSAERSVPVGGDVFGEGWLSGLDDHSRGQFRYFRPLSFAGCALGGGDRPAVVCERESSRAEEMRRKAVPIKDLWSLAKARVEATRKLEAEGVPRTAIDAGFDYNVWTELMISGHINDHRVFNPPGAYRPGLSQTPSVVPLYKLEFAPTPETPASKFGSVPYSSLLPPFHKQVSIDCVLLASPSDR